MTRILFLIAALLISAINSYGAYTKTINDTNGYVFQCHGVKHTMNGKENQLEWTDDNDTVIYIVKINVIAGHYFSIDIYRQTDGGNDCERVYRSTFGIVDYEIYADEFSKSGLRFNFKQLGPITLFSKLDCMKYYNDLKDTPNEIVEKSYNLKEVYPRIELCFSDYKFIATIDHMALNDGKDGYINAKVSWLDVLDFFKNKLNVPLITD